jgi:hypothetical protein
MGSQAWASCGSPYLTHPGLQGQIPSCQGCAAPSQGCLLLPSPLPPQGRASLTTTSCPHAGHLDPGNVDTQLHPKGRTAAPSKGGLLHWPVMLSRDFNSLDGETSTPQQQPWVGRLDLGAWQASSQPKSPSIQQGVISKQCLEDSLFVSKHSP